MYFDKFPWRSHMPSPADFPPGQFGPTALAKIVTVGDSEADRGGSTHVVEPCSDTISEGGCRSALQAMGIRYCSPAANLKARTEGDGQNHSIERLNSRDETFDISNIKFRCYGANNPPNMKGSLTRYASIVTNTSTWVESMTSSVEIPQDEGLVSTLEMSGYAVNIDGVTITDTTLNTYLASSTSMISISGSSMKPIDRTSTSLHSSTLPVSAKNVPIDSNPEDPFAQAGPAAIPTH